MEWSVVGHIVEDGEMFKQKCTLIHIACELKNKGWIFSLKTLPWYYALVIISLNCIWRILWAIGSLPVRCQPQCRCTVCHHDLTRTQSHYRIILNQVMSCWILHNQWCSVNWISSEIAQLHRRQLGSNKQQEGYGGIHSASLHLFKE